jgi:hypothetical protein
MSRKEENYHQPVTSSASKIKEPKRAKRYWKRKIIRHELHSVQIKECSKRANVRFEELKAGTKNGFL